MELRSIKDIHINMIMIIMDMGINTNMGKNAHMATVIIKQRQLSKDKVRRSAVMVMVITIIMIINMDTVMTANICMSIIININTNIK